jgi:glucose/arabinose dehydrogenase
MISNFASEYHSPIIHALAMAITFNPVGAFLGVPGGYALNNPTSLAFGPDGRLYVSEQNGTINAFTIALQNGQYIATAREELLSANGSGVVKSIMNHNDNGSNNLGIVDRQVTGLVVTQETDPNNPNNNIIVLYVSSSDPRIATDNDSNLDTNSGILTRVSQNGSSWDAVDIVRGLPRSEENHSTNGMVLSADGTKLYLTVGGNTNNGAPSSFFAYTGEYALSGTVLEIDLVDIKSRPVLTDSDGGQVGGVAGARNYVYDLPTLDDPNIANNGIRENASGLDVNGPFGGNDGLNMAVLPSTAPLRIYADGFRNTYDLVLTETGKLYTWDNGSNGNLGGDPIVVNGEATNTPNDGGVGDPDSLFLVQDNSYYTHPNPLRSNQNLSWTVYNDSGTPDTTLAVNTVPDISALVPASLKQSLSNPTGIPTGFLIDPSKFTGDAARLAQSGVRIPATSSQTKAITTLGSSSNGLAVYTNSFAFGGALKGSLLVASFNGTVSAVTLNSAGTALTPLKDPGIDGVLGTGDDITLSSVNTLIAGLSTPLDVIEGPNGTIWVAEIGGDFIKVFSPSGVVAPGDPDYDKDGILNVSDPFIRDVANGTGVQLLPGQTLLWDFDANQDGNLPGLNGYGGGLTGVMVNGTTDFEKFFLEPATTPGNVINLDNVKFITAAGGGTTVVENVANGDPLLSSNSGQYLFHTGVKIAPSVDTFTIKWTIFNPGEYNAQSNPTGLRGPFQQIGGYIGTGDQNNYLKIVATKDTGGELQVLLENNDVIVASSYIQADDLFAVTTNDNKQIYLELTVNPVAGTATPTVRYQTISGGEKTVTGTAINLDNTKVLDAIRGSYVVQGQPSGLAVGLLSSNNGQTPTDTFQAVFADVEITAASTSTATVLYRVNAGGPQVAAIDGGPNWLADAGSSALLDAGSNSTAAFPAVNPGSTVPSATTPGAIFDTERYDAAGGTEMQYGFAVSSGTYEVRLYMGNGFTGTAAPGQRVFDVLIEGNLDPTLDNVDLSARFGNTVGGMISKTVQVTDGTLNIQFLHGVENPLLNGIEILQLPTAPTANQVSIAATTQASEPSSNGLFTVSLTQPSTTDTVITYSVAGTATGGAGGDYQTLSGSVTILATQTTATIALPVLDDLVLEGNESVIVNLTGVSGSSGIALSSTNKTATVTIADNDGAGGGQATLKITPNNSNIQVSTFGNNSFTIANSGGKVISQFEIDVTNALYPDMVFDPFGLAGDSVAKVLTINASGNTGVVTPGSSSYVGLGGTAGYKGLKLVFDPSTSSGFNPGETVGFSIDMDPNSIRGTNKTSLDAGTSPSWDVGGVSGAELIGSTFKVTFADGTTATGQLQGDSSQAGAQGLASQNSAALAVSLTINGLGAGGTGVYTSSGPNVIVNGPAGKTARIVMTKGFIQPTTPYATFLQSQLAALAASPFPANNAVEFQTRDVLLTGSNQNISNLFDVSGVANYNFTGENQVPLAFVASVIDPTNGNLPNGPVTQPIYLNFNKLSSSLRLEGESADIITNYRIENLPVASGGKALSLVAGGSNETGSATFTYRGSAGKFDILLGTFDENDGIASFNSSLKDFETGITTNFSQIQLNKNLGSPNAVSSTMVTPLLASSINLTPGDQLTVFGFENATEHARLDFIQFTPVL